MEQSSEEQSSDKECIPCNPGEAAVGGFCERCPGGFVPTRDKTGCEHCTPPKRPNGDKCSDMCHENEIATPFTCRECPPGSALNKERTVCVPGADSSANHNGNQIKLHLAISLAILLFSRMA